MTSIKCWILKWEKVLVLWSQGQRSSAVSLSKKMLVELEAAGDADSRKMLPQVFVLFAVNNVH